MLIQFIFSALISQTQNLPHLPANLDPTKNFRRSIIDAKKFLPTDDAESFEVTRPYAEYENAKYLLFSDDVNYGTQNLKLKLIQNLPSEIELIIVKRSATSNLADKAKRMIGDRLHTLTYSHGQAFWSRDALPIPVFENVSTLGLADAQYYYSFDEDKMIADRLSANVFKHKYEYEGGNFLADSSGRCFIVNNNRHQHIPDEIFTKYYGCHSLVRIPHLEGIGHIDEVVKFLSDKVAITNRTEYVEILEKNNFEVHLAPRSPKEMQSYVNSLLINGILFLPIYNQDTDAAAKTFYESFGLKVIELDAETLATGMGSVHCITMTFPPAPYKELEAKLSF